MGATASKETPAPEPTGVQARPGHHQPRRTAAASSTSTASGSSSPSATPSTTAAEDDDDDDEPDEWDKRIFSTGCADEQLKMNDCYYEKRDWRVCSKEMEAFRECWKRNGNDVRTSTKDA